MARPELELDGNELEATPGAGNKQWVAKISGRHPKYNYERDFVMYQKPRTTERDHGKTTLENGDIIEIVYHSHSGKEKPRTYQMFWDGQLVEVDDVDEALDNPEEFVPEPVTHECEECGKEFDSEHGVAVHAGIVHSDDEEESEEMTAEADDAPVAVADGGADLDEFEIDPLALEFDIENRWRDSTNSITRHLDRIDGTDIWVSWSSWKTGDGPATAIDGIGRWSIEAADLETKTMTASIIDEADRLEAADVDGGAQLAEALREHAEEFADELETNWAHGVGEVVGDAIHEGYAAVEKRVVWTSHVEEALYFEAEMAWKDLSKKHDIEDIDADHGGQSILQQALYDAVSQLRRRFKMQHAEYVGRLDFEVEPWELRALELRQHSSLGGWEQCRLQALRERKTMTQTQMAEALGINQSTVSRQLAAVDDRLEKARWTVKNVGNN